MTIREILKWGHERLVLTSDSARLDAEVLLAHALKKPVTFLMAHDEVEVGFLVVWRYKRWIEKRKRGVPVAYLTGHKEFFMLDFVVNRHVLTPRPDTEFLVEAVIEYIQDYKKISGKKADPILLDIGTGSACIPVAILKNIEGLCAIATDVSRNALAVARRNIKKHRLQSRIKLLRSDLLEKVPIRLLRGHDVIVTANLPYIPSEYTVCPELKCEPSIALFGGHDGADVYRRLMSEISITQIKPRVIFFELFESQIAILKTALPDYRLKYIRTMTHEARVLCMEKIM